MLSVQQEKLLLNIREALENRGLGGSGDGDVASLETRASHGTWLCYRGSCDSSKGCFCSASFLPSVITFSNGLSNDTQQPRGQA